MNDAATQLAQAMDLHRAQRLDDAERVYREILAGEPENPDALHLLGVVRTQRGDARGGAILIQRALSHRPDSAHFLGNFGKALSEFGDWLNAARAYRRAIDLAPMQPDSYFNLAAALGKLGDYPNAEKLYRRTLDLAPDYVRARNNLGYVLSEMGRRDEGEACFRAVIEAHPDNVEAHINLGGALHARGAYPAAERAFRRALDLDPQRHSVYGELGSLNLSIGDLDAATAHMERALALAPNDRAAVINLAYLRVLFARFAESETLYRSAIARDPGDIAATRYRLLTVLYDPEVTEEYRASVHADFVRAAASRIPPATVRAETDRDSERRLRIGYLSGDFYGHPVARNLEPVLAQRDPAQSEVFAYAEYARPDATTERMKGLVDHWRPIKGKSDADVAAQIRADKIDILLILAGRFDRNRPQVACWQAAPLQVSFHDPGTSALKETDYLIADAELVPRGAAERFTERIVRLPSFYLHAPIDDAPEVGPLPATARGAVTFGSFNNPAKINPRILGLWGDVLRAVPTARLVLKFKNWFGSAQMQAQTLAALNVDPARVQFLSGDLAPREHLRLYNDIDIALDPYPFSGSTTTFEALSMGVPLVTLSGERMAGRWTASMLRALKLDALVARTPADYVTIAASLAHDTSRLAALRAGLRARVVASPLCDARAKARQLDRLLRAIWRRHCASPVL